MVNEDNKKGERDESRVKWKREKEEEIMNRKITKIKQKQKGNLMNKNNLCLC